MVGTVPSASLANAVDQALQACMFARDIGAIVRIVREVDAGRVLDSTDYRIDAMSFGGVKGSGLGREGVPVAAAR